ncbi:MAG: hypothetical protein WDM90_13605 [Ferruginibacter sp.]
MLSTENVCTLSAKYPNVQVYNKFIASRYNGELEKFASIPSNLIEDKIKSITDTAIQKILLNHIKNYIELNEKQKEFYNTEKAFSPDGISEMNNNILSLNDGKPHQKIFKIRTAGKMGKAFSVSENIFKKSKIVKTAGDSNFYCGFYQKGEERKYHIPTLKESIESFKTRL